MGDLAYPGSTPDFTPDKAIKIPESACSEKSRYTDPLEFDDDYPLP